jgi:membrane fusion protein, multidrug efflux system
MRLKGLVQLQPAQPLPGRFARRRRFLLLVGSVVLIAAVVFWLVETGGRPLRGEAVRPPSQTPGGMQKPNAPDKTGGAILEVQVIKPIKRDVVQTLRLPATISPYYQTTLYSKVSGYLKSIAVDKGDVVKAGQILAVIDDPELLERYHQAQSEYQIKKVTYERLSSVRKENPDVIAKQDVDVAEATYQGAKHALDQLASMLDYTKVRAPYNGTVTARFVDPGALIQAATSSATQAVPLFTIMDVSILRFYINVPQEDAHFIKKGTPVTIAISDGPEKTVKATVTRSTVALDPGTRSLLAEIDLPNPGHDLAPGMFAEVVVELRRHPDALVVPPAALVSEGSSKFLFTVDQGVARKIPVETGIDDGLWVEITSGLTGAEDIVVTGKSRLSDGIKIKAFPYSLPEGKPASQRF